MHLWQRRDLAQQPECASFPAIPPSPGNCRNHRYISPPHSQITGNVPKPKSPGPSGSPRSPPLPRRLLCSRARRRGGGCGDAPISKAQPPPRAGSLSPPLISLLRRLFFLAAPFSHPAKPKEPGCSPARRRCSATPLPHLSFPRQPPTNRSPQ